MSPSIAAAWRISEEYVTKLSLDSVHLGER